MIRSPDGRAAVIAQTHNISRGGGGARVGLEQNAILYMYRCTGSRTDKCYTYVAAAPRAGVWPHRPRGNAPLLRGVVHVREAVKLVRGREGDRLL